MTQNLLSGDGTVNVQGTVTYTGADNAISLYDGQINGLNVGKGLLLTTGDAHPGTTNTSSAFGAANGTAGDADLQAIVDTAFAGQGFNIATHDAASLSFNFTVAPGATQIAFDIVFGSEEFPEWVNQFVDVAAVIVDGKNYATFNANDTTPLSVVSQNVASGYFINNNAVGIGANFNGVTQALPIEYDGVSKLLRIVAPLDPSLADGQPHSIKIAIADTGDSVLDSGIFISNLTAGSSLGSGVVAYDHHGSSSVDDISGSSEAEYFNLQAGDDSLLAGAGNDIVDAGSGNDAIDGGSGNDSIDGGVGDDSARYHGNRADFSITLASGVYTVVDLRPGSPEGTDVLTGVEKLNFDDVTLDLVSWDGSNPATGAAAASIVDSATPVDTAVVVDAPLAAGDPVIDTAPQADNSANGNAPVDNPPIDASATAELPAGTDSISDVSDASALPSGADSVSDQVDLTQASSGADSANDVADATALPSGADSVSDQLDLTQAASGADSTSDVSDASALPAGADSASDQLDLTQAASGADSANDVADATTLPSGSDSVSDQLDLTQAASGADSNNAIVAPVVVAETVVGTGAVDVLIGGDGADHILGGAGGDLMFGGVSNDTFVFTSLGDLGVGAKADVIGDFSQGDHLDMSFLVAALGNVEAVQNAWVDDAAFLANGQAQLHYDADTGSLSGDLNGDAKADFDIKFVGSHTATEIHDSFVFG